MENRFLFLGSSPFSVGAATVLPGCTIFEESFLTDTVYAGTLRGFDAVVGNDELSELFLRDNTYRNGRIDLLREELYLSEIALNHRMRLSFGTFVRSIAKAKQGFSVEYIDNEGVHTEEFSEIYDFRATRSSEYYRILFAGELPDFSSNSEEVRILSSFSEDVKIIDFHFREKLPVHEMKNRILTILDKNNAKGKWLGDAYAGYNKNVEVPTRFEGVKTVNPYAGNDPINAFARGVVFGKELIL